MGDLQNEIELQANRHGGSGISADQAMLMGKSPYVRAGSLGVRGLIEISSLESADISDEGADGGSRAHALSDFIQNALSDFRDQTVRRIHLFTSRDNPAQEIASALGFAIPAGELLHEREIPRDFVGKVSLPFGYVLRNGVAQDLVRLHSTITEARELAFQGWEIPIIGDSTQMVNRFFKVIEFGEEIVGLSIGGALEKRGTISHLWVDPNHRNKDLGSALVDESLRALLSAGAETVHLITVEGNDGGRRFWERQQFKVSDRVFYEIDL